MRKLFCIGIFAISICSPAAIAENMVVKVRKAVERSTLNQPGTKPFHLKATVAPSFERDNDSGRNAEVEIWWASPNQWRREIRSPEFHQVQILNNNHEWQNNEGDFFPEWLRETEVQLINPLPSLEEVLEHVKTGETKNFMGQINIEWTATTGTAEVRNIQRFSVALQPSTGLLLYTYGFGWGAEFKDYRDFHGRMVARTVNVGTPQDREGRVREIDGIVSENSAVNDTGREAVMNMHFKPFLASGIPVQVVSQFTLPFKATPPAGQVFDSAHNYFERGRKSSFPTGNGAPYVMHAEFQFRQNGVTANGQYQDTWLSDEQWLRNASYEKDECERSRDREKTYRVMSGTSAGFLCLVLRALEPIPAIDTFLESDWRIRRDALDGTQTIRGATGSEDPNGKFDSQARGYWFDNSGVLLRAYFNGLEIRRSDFQDFNGLKLARQIDVLKDGKLALKIRVTEVASGTTVRSDIFKLNGHEWQRMFTDEAR